MGYWKFLDYITEGHRNPILDWYGTVDKEVQAAFDVLIQDLIGTEDWDAPKPAKRKYRLLRLRHAGMCELIFKVGARKFRPLGILDRQNRIFVFLGGCEHKRYSSIPPNAFDDALALKTQLEQGKGATREHI
jgi:hypothetical protein